MQTLQTVNDENEQGFFDGQAFETMHNKSAKKHGLDRNEKKAAKLYRDARKNKRAFNA